MTVTRRNFNGIEHLYGLAADSKPAAVTGSKFWETDTGVVYTYSGSEWFLADDDGAGGAIEQGGAGTEAWPMAPQQIISTTGTVTRVPSSATTGQLIAANSSRAGLIVHNNSTADLYIKYGTTADIAGGDESYTYQIPAGAVWRMDDPPYTGRIDAIWESANGFAMVTELT